MTQELNALREDLRGYHLDVKRRLTTVEDNYQRLFEAIHGVAGDTTRPGLNLQVNGLLAFRERVRLGLGAAWAGFVTLASIVFAKR